MITTIRGTGNVLQARRVVDMSNKIDVLEPDSAPLVQLSKKMKKDKAINSKITWMDEDPLTKTDAVNNGAGYTASATSIVVDNASKFREGDVVRNVTSGEQVLVTAVDTSTNTLTVRRGWGSTSATAWSDNDVLLIVGNANPEGATKRDAKIQDQTERVNYLQIFRTPFGVTATVEASKLYGGSDLKHQRITQLIEHQKEIERAFWFGEPKADTSNDEHPRRATGGVDYWISTNGKDAGGDLTQIEFNEFLRTGFRYGSRTKWLFSAPLVTDALSYWGAQKLQVTPRNKTFGIAVKQWLSPFGMVNVVNDNLFAETDLYSGYAFLIDPAQPKYAYLPGRDTKLKTNIQDNSADAEEDEYLSEVGLKFHSEKKASVLYGVTSYS